MRKIRLILILWAFVAALPVTVLSQLTVTSNSNAVNLAQNLVGPGITIFNETLNCGTNGAGTFTAVSTNLGLTGGILLTSGTVANSVGPNNSTSQTGTGIGVFSDADLNNIATSTTYDGCILEFDLIPYCDTISIDYVFGSEEYPEFVNSTFNDAFGFFLSGPNITGSINLALIPNTTTPVTINNVNNGTAHAGPCMNCAYYVDNTNGTDVQYDGFTVPLTAISAVTPCDTYHIKLAVCDVGDGSYDSGVFLAQNGFQCASPTITLVATTSNPNVTELVEGCIDGFINITRSGDTTNALVLTVTTGGTATDGVDYSGVPTTLTVPAMSSSTSLSLTSLYDLLPEGQETIQIIFSYSFCNNTVSDTVNLVINDAPIADAGPDHSICAGAPDTIGVQPITGNLYQWSPTTGLSSSTVSNPTLTLSTPGLYSYVLSITDTFGCPASDTILITVYQGPPASITGNLFICDGDATTLTASGATQYLWSTNATTPSITVNPTVTTTYTVVGINNGCLGAPASATVTVFPIPTANFTINPQSICEGDQVNIVYTGSSGSGASYDWNFSGGSVISGSGAGPYDVTWANAGTKNITLQVTENGCVSPLITVVLNVNPIPVALAGSALSTCAGQNVTLQGQATGAGPSYTYNWSPPTFLSNPNIANPVCSPTSTTQYCLTVSSNGCTSTPSCVTVSVTGNPIVDAGPDVYFCDGSAGVLLDGSVQGGNAPYIYVWAPNNGSLTNPNIEDPSANPDSITTYYFYAIGSDGCLSNVDSVVVTPVDLPVVDVGTDVWRCENGPGNFITATVVNPVGGYSVQWSPSAGLYCDTCLTTYATPDTTTVYCAVVTSLLTGCTSDLTNLNSNSCLVYTVRPRPVADAGPDFEMCQYDTTSTCGIATSAGPLYSFAWSPNFGVNDSTLVCPDFYPPFTTLYTLVVTSNGCPSYADSVLVTVRPTLSADAGQVRTICADDSTQLDGQYNGAWPPTAFLWTPSAGLNDSTAQTPMASPAATTWYYFTVFNGLCPSIPDSVQVIVNPRPISNAGPDLQLCPEGDSISITGATATAGLPPYTYLWQPSSGLQDANLLNPNLKPDTTTLYTLTVFTGTAPNVCTDMDTMLVTVKPGLNIIVDVDTNTICQGQVTQLTSSAGSGSAVFSWSPTLGLSNANLANTMANPDTTVTYVLTVTEHGCTGYDSIHIRVLDTPDAAFTASSTESCGELSVAFLNLSADGSAYEWNFGDGNISNQMSPVYTYTQPGTYTVTLVALSQGGCADTIIQTNIVSLSDPGLADFRSTPEPPVEVSLPNSSTISFYDQSQLAVSWTWDFGDGVSSTDRNPNHTFVNPGVYYVTLTTKTADGCESILRKGPYTVFTPELFVPNVFTPNNDGMNDGFLTNYGGDEAFLLQIFDRWGTKFFQTTNKNEAWQGTNLNGSKATDGVYFYTLRIGDRNYSGNVTLMR